MVRKYSILMVTVAVILSAQFVFAGGIIYVDDSAAGLDDGSSWENAYPDLQDALTVAAGGEDIRVGQGTYMPTTGSDSNATFQLVNGVALRGGYAGFGEANPDERDVELYETILSGDIGTPQDNSDNSFHVITGSGTDGTAVLDGFTITGGNAAGTNPDNRGGGMFNYEGNPTVINCTFSGNSADSTGGGMLNLNNSSPTVTNCTFSGNSATNYGGGMYCESSSPTVTNCTFSGNSASFGGGMFNFSNSSPTVTNCTFSGNSANFGGGMFNWDNSSPTVTNCTFSGNTAGNYGGGIRNFDSSPTVTNCTFSGNSAGIEGGGMYSKGSSSVSIPVPVENFSFEQPGTDELQNWESVPGWSSDTVASDSGVGSGWPGSTEGGWAGYIMGADPTVWQLTDHVIRPGQIFTLTVDLQDNYSVIQCDMLLKLYYDDAGTRMPVAETAVIPLTRDQGGWVEYALTFAADAIPAAAGHRLGIEFDNISPGGDSWVGMDNVRLTVTSPPKMTNCILWGNSPDQIAGPDTTDVSYSDVEGSWTGDGNIDEDPLFVDAASGDLRLASFLSPCVDTGDNNAPHLLTDLAGNLRVVDGDRDGTPDVDMGAFEFQGIVHNITQQSWYETIQPAIDGANGGDEIEVQPGTYYETILFDGKAVRLYSSGGPEVTIIDGTGHYHVVQCLNGADPVLEGFTITGGNADGSYPHDRGGGMHNHSSSPTVTNCIFSGNSAVKGGGMDNNAESSPTVNHCSFSDNSANHDGGGMHNYLSNPTVTNCIFSGNSSGNNGGGMYGNFSSPTVTNCTFSNNSAYHGGGMCNANSSPTVTNCTFSGNAAWNGGGMYNDNSSPTVTNCTFSGNSADWDGGGMYNNNSSPTVTNCTFSGNSADWDGGGGGMLNYQSSPTVTNCTFSGNSATRGGGICSRRSSDPNLTNCILWGNTAPNRSQIYIYDDGTSSVAVTYSDVQGGYNGTGNIDADPLFVDADGEDNISGTEDDNLRLAYNSPCIDAGDSAGLLAVPILFDLDGNDRYHDIENIADSGVGTYEFVDMGAYEFSCSGLVGDLNCDGVVNLLDLRILAYHWLESVNP